MYLTLDINQQLANAMRAVAEAKTEIGVFARLEEKSNVKRVSMESVNELDEILCNVICRIASLSGCVIADDVVSESKKEIKNRLNPEDHVSK